MAHHKAHVFFLMSPLIEFCTSEGLAQPCSLGYLYTVHINADSSHVRVHLTQLIGQQLWDTRQCFVLRRIRTTFHTVVSQDHSIRNVQSFEAGSQFSHGYSCTDVICNTNRNCSSLTVSFYLPNGREVYTSLYTLQAPAQLHCWPLLPVGQFITSAHGIEENWHS
jgi:hypothetical protein